MAVGETPGQGCQKWLQRFVRILSRKHDEMSLLRLNNCFRLQKTNTAARRWKQPSKKSFHRVSRDKILHDSWSISAAFFNRYFERGEGPGDEVDHRLPPFNYLQLNSSWFSGPKNNGFWMFSGTP